MPRGFGCTVHLARGFLAAVAGGAIVVGGVTGCSAPLANGEDAADLGTVSIEAYGDLTAVLDFEAGTARLPLDEVAIDSPVVYARDFQALWVMIDHCMVERGFSPVSETVDWVAEAGREDRTFGLWSVARASEYGPDLPPGGKSTLVDTLSFGGEYNAELPACIDSAKQEKAEQLSTVLPVDSPGAIGRQIWSAAYQATLSSDGGKKAVARRVACLEDQGIVVNPDSGGPSSEYFVDQRTAITTAVAEAECNVETGAVQELYNVMARYQQAYMDQREAQIVELAAQRAELLRELDAIILGR